MMEIEFDEKKEMLEAVDKTDKPLMVGEVTGWNDAGIVSKTVRITCVDDYGNEPVLLSFNFFVGREHMLTEELKKQLNDEAKAKQKAALEQLNKATEEIKVKTRAELEEKGFKVFYGNWKTPTI